MNLLVLVVLGSVCIECKSIPILGDIMEPPIVTAGEEIDSDETCVGGKMFIPELRNQHVFRLPKELTIGDTIVIDGYSTRSPFRFELSLATGQHKPDFRDVALQLIASGTNKPEDYIIVQTIKSCKTNQRTNITNCPAEYFPDTTISIKLVVDSTGDNIKFYIYTKHTYINEIQTEHALKDIRYLTLNSDTKLNSLRFDIA